MARTKKAVDCDANGMPYHMPHPANGWDVQVLLSFWPVLQEVLKARNDSGLPIITKPIRQACEWCGGLFPLEFFPGEETGHYTFHCLSCTRKVLAPAPADEEEDDDLKAGSAEEFKAAAAKRRAVEDMPPLVPRRPGWSRRSPSPSPAPVPAKAPVPVRPWQQRQPRRPWVFQRATNDMVEMLKATGAKKKYHKCDICESYTKKYLFSGIARGCNTHPHGACYDCVKDLLSKKVDMKAPVMCPFCANEHPRGVFSNELVPPSSTLTREVHPGGCSLGALSSGFS
eukprot:jgi/Mesvir1/7737/Mv11681-RA.1